MAMSVPAESESEPMKTVPEASMTGGVVTSPSVHTFWRHAVVPAATLEEAGGTIAQRSLSRVPT